MLVEDDKNLLSIYGDRLKAEGHTILSANDGEEALSLAMKEKPDLIISDVMMPKISGFDMLDILRTTPETKDVKIIMMTALSQAEDKERADKLGADKYLVKSQVTLDDVARTVDEMIKAGGTKPKEGDKMNPSTQGPATDNPSDSTVTPTTDNSPMASEPSSSAVPMPTPTTTPSDNTSPTPPAGSVPPSSDDQSSTSSAQAEPSVDEQAEISAQIDDFLAKNAPTTTSPTPPAQPSTEASSPAPETTAPAPSVPPVSSAPTGLEVPPSVHISDAPSNSSEKKIIEPIPSDSSKPDIFELYEKEMAKGGDSAPAQPVAGSVVTATPSTTNQPAPPAPAAPSSPVFDVTPPPAAQLNDQTSSAPQPAPEDPNLGAL